MRDYRKLTAFTKADTLALAVYRWTDALPSEERYVLRSQIRRCAISVPANIVEGSARTSHGEYTNHLNIALGSAAELAYLIDLAGRIYPSLAPDGHSLPDQAAEVVRVLVVLVDRLQHTGPKPKA
jgi:four helix bundle protein